jgi:hypothetical protein
MSTSFKQVFKTIKDLLPEFKAMTDKMIELKTSQPKAKK